MATPNRSASAADILPVVMSRLRTVLNKSDGYVRLVINPNPDEWPYRAEEGIHVAVYPPVPANKCPNGRYATLVKRAVEVHVVSECMLDVAGRDDTALLRHTRLEESVVDAVMDSHPSHTAGQQGPAALITWVGTGTPPRRPIKDDVALVHSVLLFELSYAFPFTVPAA